jgi:hypothetical protein
MFSFGMLPPNVLRDIQLHQGIRQRLTAIPIVIFGVGIKGNNYGSSIVYVRDAFIGHVIDFPFSFFTGEIFQ